MIFFEINSLHWINHRKWWINGYDIMKSDKVKLRILHCSLWPLPFPLIGSETIGSVNHRHEFRARFFPQSTRLQTAPVTGNLSPSLVKPIRTLNTSFLRTCELMVTRAESATASRAVVNYTTTLSSIIHCSHTHSSLHTIINLSLSLLFSLYRIIDRVRIVRLSLLLQIHYQENSQTNSINAFSF